MDVLASPDPEVSRSEIPAQDSEGVDLDTIEKVFMEYVGPMGSIILDEILDGLSLSRGEKINRTDLPEVIRKLSQEIEEEEEKAAFEEEMFQRIKI